jgi:hypothetical protein
MANRTAFKKGEKKPNQGKRGPGKATLKAREAIAKLVDGNTHRLEGWLDEIAADEKQGPAVAFKLLMDVMEYHVPKLARHELTGKDGAPMETVTRIELVAPALNGSGSQA